MQYWSIPVLITILLAFTALSAFCSLCEAAFTNTTKLSFTKWHQNYQKNHKQLANDRWNIRAVQKLLGDFSRTISLVIILNTIINVSVSSLLTILAYHFNYSALGIFLVTFITVISLLFLGELWPKIFARSHSDGIVYHAARGLLVLKFIFFPILFIFSLFPTEDIRKLSENDITSISNILAREGKIEHEEKDLIRNAVNFDDRSVASCFTPIKTIVSIDDNVNLATICDLFIKTGFSRLPIINKYGRYVGVIVLRDAFTSYIRKQFSTDIKPLIHPTIFINITTSLSAALRILQFHQKQIAFITNAANPDVTNNVVGIITVEDLLEQLVGAIYDENDEKSDVRTLAHQKFVILGNVDLKHLFSIHFPNINPPKTTAVNLTNWVKELNFGSLKFTKKHIYYLNMEIIPLSKKNKYYANEYAFEVIIHESQSDYLANPETT